MKAGVTWAGIVIGGITVIEIFLMTRNLLWLLAYIPIHGILALLMMHECRFFELLGLWGRTKGINYINGSLNPRYWAESRKHWKASSYSPLRFGLPNLEGQHNPVIRR